MAWVKLHDDILGDPKLMRAARVGGTELVLLPWLLAFASKAADHGRLSVGATSAEPEDLAYQIPGVTAAQVEACLRALVAIGVLAADEDGCLKFAKWEDRQAKPSDSAAAIRERVKKHRDKKRVTRKAGNTAGALQGVTANPKGQESGHVTPCNATEKRRREEKRGEAEEKHLPDADASRVQTIRVVEPDSPPRPAFSLVPYADVYLARFVGSKIPGGQWGKLFKALEAKHGPAETLRRWAIFVPLKGNLGAEYFARTWSEWGGESVASNDAPRQLRATEMVIG